MTVPLPKNLTGTSCFRVLASALQRYQASRAVHASARKYNQLFPCIGGGGVVFFEARGHRTSRGAPLGHLFRAAAGPGTFGGAKDSLPDGRDRNAGTGAPWDDGGSVLENFQFIFSSSPIRRRHKT